MNLSKFDKYSIYVSGYAEAGFSNNKYLSSQLWHVVLLKYKYANAAIIHYGP